MKTLCIFSLFYLIIGSYTLWGQSQNFQEDDFIVEGIVEDIHDTPLEGIHVMVLGLEGFKPVVSNQEGRFIMRIPRDMPIDDSHRLVVFHPEKEKSKMNYTIAWQENNLINFKVEFVPRKVRKVRIFDAEGNPAIFVPLHVDNHLYISNQKGICNINHPATDGSIFHIDNFPEVRLQYDYDRLEMAVYIDKVNANLTSPEAINPSPENLSVSKMDQ